MTLLKDIKNCIAFLTRIPISKEVNIFKEVAPKIWLFPIVGLILGLFSSLISLILFRFLPIFLVGFIILGFSLFMTGAHHADGLFDFGDGLMVMGSPERKISVMHDVAIGAGGLTLGLIILSLIGLSLSYSINYIIIALILSEISAKFNMVAACSIGRSAKTKMADVFISLTKKKHMIFSLSLSVMLILISIFISTIYSNIYYSVPFMGFLFSSINMISLLNPIQLMVIISVFLIGTLLPLIFVLKLSNKNFNGLTGDCLGALNEITRLFVLILLVVANNLRLI